jgi:hypothetical protein
MIFLDFEDPETSSPLTSASPIFPVPMMAIFLSFSICGQAFHYKNYKYIVKIKCCCPDRDRSYYTLQVHFGLTSTLHKQHGKHYATVNL